MSTTKSFMWSRIVFPDLQAHLTNKEYHLVQWPDFGVMEHNPKYIEICSLLSKDYYSYDDLIKLTSAETNSLNHFLNTAAMQSLIDTRPETRKSHGFSKDKSKSTFRAKLRSLISFAYKTA